MGACVSFDYLPERWLEEIYLLFNLILLFQLNIINDVIWLILLLDQLSYFFLLEKGVFSYFFQSFFFWHCWEEFNLTLNCFTGDLLSGGQTFQNSLRNHIFQIMDVFSSENIRDLLTGDFALGTSSGRHSRLHFYVLLL